MAGGVDCTPITLEAPRELRIAFGEVGRDRAAVHAIYHPPSAGRPTQFPLNHLSPCATLSSSPFSFPQS